MPFCHYRLSDDFCAALCMCYFCIGGYHGHGAHGAGMGGMGGLGNLGSLFEDPELLQAFQVCLQIFQTLMH